MSPSDQQGGHLANREVWRGSQEETDKDDGSVFYFCSQISKSESQISSCRPTHTHSLDPRLHISRVHQRMCVWVAWQEILAWWQYAGTTVENRFSPRSISSPIIYLLHQSNSEEVDRGHGTLRSYPDVPFDPVWLSWLSAIIVMGAKDEEFLLIHATMHYNEYCSSAETLFYCFCTHFSYNNPFSLFPPSSPPTLCLIPTFSFKFSHADLIPCTC